MEMWAVPGQISYEPALVRTADRSLLIIPPAKKEVMFSLLLVCLFVCLSVSKITQNVVD